MYQRIIEIQKREELLARLRAYVGPLLTPILANGSDQTLMLQMHLDVNNFAPIPRGKIETSIPLIMGDERLGRYTNG